MLISAGFFIGDLLITCACSGVCCTVSIVYPTVSLENFLSLIQAVSIGLKLVSKLFLGLLIHPHCKAIRTMYNGAEALCECVSELVPVEQVSYSMTNCLELCRTEVALEHELAVTVAEIIVCLEVAFSCDIQSGVDLATVCETGQNVDTA